MTGGLSGSQADPNPSALGLCLFKSVLLSDSDEAMIYFSFLMYFFFFFKYTLVYLTMLLKGVSLSED